MPRSAPTSNPPLSGLPAHAVTALRLGTVLLRPGPRELLRDGQPVPIGARAFDLLHALAQAYPRELSAEDLLQIVWGSTRVDKNNLRVQLAKLRRLLGADAVRHRTGWGYRLGLPVEPAHDESGAPAPATRPVGNLPDRTPPLHGRTADLQELDALLSQHARLTLVGPPGVGKTLLALAAAQRVRDAHPAGVYRVELAPLTRGDSVCPTVAEALGLQPGQAARPAALARLLAERQLLCVLDNAEHVRDAVQELCDHLLRAAPGVRLLVTSRRPVKCAGEHLKQVEPLGLPADDQLASVLASGAATLFEAHARRADLRFSLGEGNAASVARICRLIDGLPLAIAFAAAHVTLWGVHGLADRLARDLHTLSLRQVELDPRHRTVQAAVRWSHELLGPLEQAVLRVLAVFSGGAPLPGVLKVAAAIGLAEPQVVKALAGLLEHSLVQTDLASLLGPASRDGVVRYTMHAVVQAWARETLEAGHDEDALRRAHADWAATLVRDTQYDWPRPPEDVLPAPADVDNLRAALTWCLAHDRERAFDLCARMLLHWRAAGLYAEARSVVEPLLEAPAPEDPPALRLRVMVRLCAVVYEARDVDRLAVLAERALAEPAVADDPTMHLLALAWSGSARHARGDAVGCLPLYQRTVQMARELGDQAQLAMQLSALGWVLQGLGRHDEARRALAQALATNERGGTAYSVALTHENLAELELNAGRPRAAQRHARAGGLAFRRGGYAFRMAFCLVLEAESLRRLGRLSPASACLHEALDLAERLGFDAVLGDAACSLALVMADDGDMARARVLLHAARRHWDRAVGGPTEVLVHPHADGEAVTGQALNAFELHRAAGAGEAMTSGELKHWARTRAEGRLDAMPRPDGPERITLV